MTRRIRTTWHTLVLTFRADPVLAIVTTSLVVLAAGTVAGTAVSQRWLIDAAGLGDVAGVVAAVLVGVLAYTISAALSRVQMNLRPYLADRVSVLVQQEVLRVAAHIPTVEHLERAEYLDRLTTLRRGTFALSALCWTVVETLAAVVSLGLSLWLLAAVHPSLFVLALCVVPVLVANSKAERLKRTARDAVAQTVRREEAIHALCLQSDSAKEVQIAGNGPELNRRAEQLWEEITRQQRTALMKGIAWTTLGWACFFAGLAGALALVVHLVMEGRASVGDVVLVMSLAERLRQQVWGSVTGAGAIAQAGHIADHYHWLRDYAATLPKGRTAAPDSLTRGIALHGVTFSYPGAETPCLKNINLQLPAGSTVGLVGVNGAGKTTLVKLLTGMYRPGQGRIDVDGLPLTDIEAAQWATRCTGAFQDFAKLQLRAGHVVGVGDLRHLDDRDAVENAVDQAGARHTVDLLPNGLDTQLGTVFGGVDLSHGQWQKLALGRAMMRRSPLLLILDEPTAALDPQAEHELFESFSRQARTTRHRGAITILVSHRFSTVRAADLIIVLSDGQIVENGSHTELLALGGHYAELYTAQVEAHR
ncbi:ABC transporter ATP-binding protein [Kribbella speibonae]|uniref:ABC transporter ATP-binding protein n=1 Tax=Kribbella speibonae TaxID=1572660 RepID=A0A4R0IR87_9ACTN|nr:ABC transporter ATP-binding protein [Kribbella speibonae]TCC36291.1 ABC transporter ATP-binding protein [Kribbella speibonae]